MFLSCRLWHAEILLGMLWTQDYHAVPWDSTITYHHWCNRSIDLHSCLHSWFFWLQVMALYDVVHCEFLRWPSGDAHHFSAAGSFSDIFDARPVEICWIIWTCWTYWTWEMRSTSVATQVQCAQLRSFALLKPLFDGILAIKKKAPSTVSDQVNKREL